MELIEKVGMEWIQKRGMELMQSESSPIQIALTPRFKKDLRELAKRYR